MMKRVFFYVLLLFMGALLSVAACLTIQPSQEYFGWVLLGILLVMMVFSGKKKLFIRVCVLVFGVFISLRYMTFRTFYTLQFEDLISFVLGLMLFFAEFYAVLVHFIGIFVNVNPRTRQTPPLPARLPRIDIFIPTYNEDEQVAYITALACANFDYPRDLVTVYILDDGSRLNRLNDPALREKLLERSRRLRQLAESAGAIYLTRTDGAQAKAGMVNAAFCGQAFTDVVRGDDGVYSAAAPVRTSGDLILILDCDHIPTRDMPRNVVGHFSNPKVFMVQTPHFMINIDPLRKNLGKEDRLPCESWLFYSAIQKGLDRWNASFFCGSAAFLRRTALAEVGGLCGDTITEDAETALALHGRGFESVYVSKPMVAGLAPESFDDMISQRVRWCQGMLQILILKCPLFKGGLTLAQRFCYLNGCIFWLFPVFRLIFLLAPLMFLLFGLNIYNSSVAQVVSFAGPHILASIILAAYMFGKLRPWLHSEILETIQCVFLIPAVVSVIVSPRKPTFKTTPKGVTLEFDKPSRRAAPFIVLLLLMSLGFGMGIYKWFEYPLLHEALTLTMFWNAFNVLVVVCCLGILWERRQRRGAHRFNSDDPVSLDGVVGKLRNLSYGGFCAHLPGAGFMPGQEVVFESNGFRDTARVLRTGEGYIAGAFQHDEPGKSVDFVYGDSRRWERIQQEVLSKKHGGYLRQTGQLLSAALVGALRFTYGVLRKTLPLILLGALLPVLMAGQSQAEESSVSLDSILLEKNYTVTSAEGELRLPLTVPHRWLVQSIIVDLVYRQSPLLHPDQSQITLSLDGQDVPGTVTLLGDGSFKARFSISEGGSRESTTRILAVKIKQTPDDSVLEKQQKKGSLADIWTTLDLSKCVVSTEYDDKDIDQDNIDIRMLFDEKVTFHKDVHMIIPELTDETLARAGRVAQKIATMLVARPVIFSVSQEAAVDRDSILIDDTADDRQVSPKFAVLRDTSFPDVTSRKRNILHPGKPFTFSDFGVETLFFTRITSPRFMSFLIPSVTRLTPNQKLSFSIDTAYSSGLRPESRLEIYMNDNILAWIRLDNPEGESQFHYNVDIPTSLLKKGENVIEMRPVMVPENEDQWNVSANDKLFLVVFSSSSLMLPDTGTYVELPDLSTLFIDGYPFVGDGTVHISEPTNAKTAAMLGMAGIIAQRRGTIGSGVDYSTDQWSVEDENAYIFALDPKAPPRTLVLEERLIPNALAKVTVTFGGKTEQDLLDGVHLLVLNPSLRNQIRGVRALTDLDAGTVVSTPGETIILSNVWPMPGLAYYTNNYPHLTQVVVVLVLFIFSLFVFFSVRNKNELEGNVQ